MTPAAVLAPLAGTCTAAAIVEAARAVRTARATRAARAARAVRTSRVARSPDGAGTARPSVAEDTSSRSGSPDTGPRPGRARRPATALAATLVAALAALGRRAGLPLPATGELGDRLDAAGAGASVLASDVLAAKAGAALAALGLALALGARLPGRLGVAATVLLPCAAFLAPDAYLARRARHRGTRMAAEVADVLDLLRVAVAAGLPAGRAMGEVGRRHPGLLAAELAAGAARIELGVPRAEVLERLRRRCPLPAVTALVAAVARAERHGAPLAPALASLAADARAEQARALQDRAARAAPKVQLVVALLLVPAVMLLVAAALLSSLGTA